jgi:hypothetical protein
MTAEEAMAAADIINNRVGAIVVVVVAVAVAVADMISSKEAATDSNKAEAMEAVEEDMINSKEVATSNNRAAGAMDTSRAGMEISKAEATNSNKEVVMDSSKEADMDKEVKADTAMTATEEEVAAVGDTALKTAQIKDTTVEVEETNSKTVGDPVTALAATLILSKLSNMPNNLAAETAISSRLQCRSSATRASIISLIQTRNSSWAHIKHCMAADKVVSRLILLIRLGLGQRCRR